MINPRISVGWEGATGASMRKAYETEKKEAALATALWWRERSGEIRSSDLLRRYDGRLDIGGAHQVKRRSDLPKGRRVVSDDHCHERHQSHPEPQAHLWISRALSKALFDPFYCTHQKIHMERVQVVTTTCPILKWKRKASRKWVTSSSVSSINHRKPTFGITIHLRGVILAKLTRCLHCEDSSDRETS